MIVQGRETNDKLCETKDDANAGVSTGFMKPDLLCETSHVAAPEPGLLFYTIFHTELLRMLLGQFVQV